MRGPRHRSALVARLVSTGPGSSQEVILGELRRVILDGGAPPGSPVPLDDVAALFGVSRIPVRESLKTLVGEGLVDHQPRAGYTVAQLTRDELVELYVVREVLEAAALSAAVPQAQPGDDAEAAAAHRALEQAVLHGDAHAHQRGSRRFHLALLRPARTHRLLHMLEQAWNLTEPQQTMTHATAVQRVQLHADHQQMLDAFTARDLAALLAASERHHRHLASQVQALPEHIGLFAEPS